MFPDVTRGDSLKGNGIDQAITDGLTTIMRVYDTRPAATDLRYQLYARALHPELFEIRAEHRLEHPAYQVVIRICEAGHLTELRRNGEALVEVNVDKADDIPERGRCLSTSLKPGRDLQCQPLPNVAFQASVQLERVEAEVFERLTQEFHADRPRATVSHVFGSRNRMRPEAISLVFAECSSVSLSLHTFHTFPDDLAVVRTQSLYQFTDL